MKEARCHDIERKESWRDALKHICLIQNESKKINIARGRLYKGDGVVERERMRGKNSHGENVRSEDVTQTLLHTDVFTHKRSYAETLLHTNVFTHTEAFIHRFQSHTRARARFYTQPLLHTLAQNCHCKWDKFSCGRLIWEDLGFQSNRKQGSWRRSHIGECWATIININRGYMGNFRHILGYVWILRFQYKNSLILDDLGVPAF